MSTTPIKDVHTVGLDAAEELIEAAKQKAEEIEVPMNIAVVSHEGNLIAFKKMDDA